MIASEAARHCATVVRQGISTFLAIAGTVALAFGLLYVLAGRALPHLIMTSMHARHDYRRGAACLAGGAACLAVAWLAHPRRGR